VSVTGDSAGTSASAGSSVTRHLPPVSSVASPEPVSQDTTALRVDFYVLEESSAAARLKLACKLAEKAYLSAQSALVWHTDPNELRVLDELLWTFMDGSFVPHEMLGAPTDTLQSPITLSAGIVPPAPVDIIINLAAELPACLSQSRRVAEIIDGDVERRRAGRARFKAYRDLGIQPASHNVRGD
jgi:DNA polymerase III subunit chi